MTIGVAIITHCAVQHLRHCLPPLLHSPLHPKVLVVNSSSHDGTVELARELGAETLVVPRASFNHGTTREYARKFLGTDIVVMMTPDAYAADNSLVERLVAPLQSGQASVSYARQIPHQGADFFESFARHFNYPATSQIRSLSDLPQQGAATFFCSNSCAAYLNSALDEIGGFCPVLLGEDTLAVAKLLRKGHKIAYVAEALVHHSHRYTLKQEFQRSFDTGLARQSYASWLAGRGSTSRRGAAYCSTLLKDLAAQAPHLIPFALAQCCVRYAGYTLGKWLVRAPMTIKRSLSSQDFYWKAN